MNAIVRVAGVIAGIFFFTLTHAELTQSRAADAAVTHVEGFHATLMDVMKQGPKLGIEGRYKKLEPKVEAAFDLATMTKFTVGPSWAKMQEAEHKDLIQAFTRMTVASYASNFAKFDGQKFIVDPNAEVRGTEKLVNSQVVPAHDKPVNLTYRIRETGGALKIIDVIYEHVSQLATRRADFSTTLASGGASALVKRLNEISDDLMKGKGGS